MSLAEELGMSGTGVDFVVTVASTCGVTSDKTNGKQRFAADESGDKPKKKEEEYEMKRDEGDRSKRKRKRNTPKVLKTSRE